MWVLPTHKRPAHCREALQALSAANIGTPGVVVVNAPVYPGEVRVIEEVLPSGWTIHVSEANLGAIGALNEVFRLKADEPWYGFLSDDERPLAPEFDRPLIEAAGRWGVAHGRYDPDNGRAQAGLVIGGALARAVGFLALPQCWHWYGLDDLWETLSKAPACKRVQVPQVVFEHRHPLYGTAPMDETYRLGESRKEVDQQEWLAFVRHRLPATVARAVAARTAAGEKV